MPNDGAAAYFERGVVYRKTGRSVLAMNDFKKVFDLLYYPPYWNLHLRSAIEMQEIGKSWSDIFSDDFTNNNRDWSMDTIVNSSFALTETIESGSYNMELDTTSKERMIIYTTKPHITVKDFYLEVFIHYIDNPPDTSCGVIFNQNENNFYYIHIKDKTISIQRMYEGELSTVMGWTSFDGSYSQYGDSINQLNILVSGGYINVFVNNDFISMVYDKDLDQENQGEIHLGVQSSNSKHVVCSFDDLGIYAPSVENAILSTPMPTSTVELTPNASFVPIDGLWKGTTSQGTEITFKVDDTKITEFSTSFMPENCSAGYAFYTQPYYLILNNTFLLSVKLGIPERPEGEFGISGDFESSDSISGTYHGTVLYTEEQMKSCYGDFSGSWTANKQ